MLPAEIRRAVTEVLLARERGRADLERARSEAAALRSLANTARLLEEHPGLLHLRTLQAAGHGASWCSRLRSDVRRDSFRQLCRSRSWALD